MGAIKKFHSEYLIGRWQSEFDIDTRRFFRYCAELGLYYDEIRGLEFFRSCIIGDSEFYAELEKIDWYYLSDE